MDDSCPTADAVCIGTTDTVPTPCEGFATAEILSSSRSTGAFQETSAEATPSNPNRGVVHENRTAQPISKPECTSKAASIAVSVVALIIIIAVIVSLTGNGEESSAFSVPTSPPNPSWLQPGWTIRTPTTASPSWRPTGLPTSPPSSEDSCPRQEDNGIKQPKNSAEYFSDFDAAMICSDAYIWTLPEDSPQFVVPKYLVYSQRLAATSRSYQFQRFALAVVNYSLKRHFEGPYQPSLGASTVVYTSVECTIMRPHIQNYYFGGVCDASFNIVGLNYFDDHAGTMPTEIGLLTDLQAIHIVNGNLEGTIPSEIGLLTRLSELNLWNNKLTGTIPTELSSLPYLSTFDVSGNDGLVI